MKIGRLFKEWQAAEGFMKRFSSCSKQGDVSLDVFYKSVWRLGETFMGHLKKGEERRDIPRAHFVFDHLDYDRNGYIHILELQKLLIQWGLLGDEIDDYLSCDDDKRLSFNEFFHNLKPVWDSAFENMTVINTGDVIIPPQNHSD